MDNNSSINNTARIIYEYNVNPNELQYIKYDCSCAKMKINVLEPVEVGIDMNKCGEGYEFYITMKNVTVYPLNIWLNIKLPYYAEYDNCSFVRDGCEIGYVDLFYDFCVGILQPQQSSTVSFCSFVKPNYTASQICIDTIIYYNMMIPYKPSAKWYCVKNDECFDYRN